MSFSLQITQQIKDEQSELDAKIKALNLPEDCKDCKHSNKDKQMSIGRKKFNMDPKKGKKCLSDERRTEFSVYIQSLAYLTICRVDTQMSCNVIALM